MSKAITGLDRWLVRLLEMWLSHPQLNMKLDQMHFWFLLIKVGNFAFDEVAVLWPETACLDRWVVRFLDYIAISAPTKAGVGPNAFLVPAYQSRQYCF